MMRPMIHGAYEWDDAKATANLAKHGLAFEAAVRAFEDPHGVTVEDVRQTYGERRINLFAHLDDAGGCAVVVVCHVVRQRIRIISARYANRRERARYFSE